MRKRKNDDLLAKALARGLSVRHAAAESGLSARTAQRRLQREDFAAKVSRMRGELLAKASGVLADASVEAARTLQTLLSDEVSDSVRLAAAKSVLTQSVELRGAVELESRILALEKARDAQIGNTLKLA